MPKRETARFIVEVTLPKITRSRRYAREYIREAVEMWSGQDYPESPTFYFCSPHHGGYTKVKYLKETVNANRK